MYAHQRRLRRWVDGPRARGNVVARPLRHHARADHTLRPRSDAGLRAAMNPDPEPPPAQRRTYTPRMEQHAVRSSTGGTSRRDRRPNRLNENGRETQERILRAAERLFAERGIDAVSTREIIEAAGVNSGSIHYHFGT